MNIENILERWKVSGKKNLLITGSLSRGKSTCFEAIVDKLQIDAVYTKAIYEDTLRPTHVEISSNVHDESFTIAEFKERMVPHIDDLNTHGVRYLSQLQTSIIGIDEIGFLERDAIIYTQTVEELFEKKRVVAVIRKNKTNEWMERLRQREDTLYIDLDDENYPVDVIIMASGHSQRFKENKLLVDWFGQTLFEETLTQIPFDMVGRVVVVTRYKEIKAICKKYPVTCIVHEEERQSDTIVLGMGELETSLHEGVMFVTSDQPLRTKESIRSIILKFMEDTSRYVRLAYDGKRGNPVIFPKVMDEELRKLQPGEKGNTVLKRYPHLETLVEANNRWELIDMDTQETYEELRNIHGKGN